MTPEEEIDHLQRQVRLFSEAVADLTAQRKAAEGRLLDLKYNREHPVAMAILAARHLDPDEGGLHVGGVVMPADLAAIRTVLRFVAAHRECGKVGR